jgi:antitoxin YefM
MCRHHGADDVKHEHRPPAGLGLERGENIAATDAPGQPLGDRQAPAVQFDPTDPQRRHLGPAEAEGGAQPDHGPVPLRQLRRDTPGVFGSQVVAPGALDCPTLVVPYLVRLRGVPMAMTASEARKNLFPLIEQVNNDRQPIEITSKRGDAVLMARADYEALEETAYLLRAPANARRLLESLEQARSGKRQQHDLL